MRRTLGALLLTFFASSAWARPGSTERYPVGTGVAGVGGAGIAWARSPWHNPAGLGRVRDAGLSGTVSAYGYSKESTSNFVQAGAINGSLETSAVDLFPASLEYVKPLGALDTMRHGLGLTVTVPDFSQFDGYVDVPAEDFLYELRGRRLAEWQTFWIHLGWGGCVSDGGLCFGVAPAAAILLQEEVNIITTFTEYEDEETSDGAVSNQSEILSAALGAQVGMQWQLTPAFRIGATVRSPVRSLWSSGRSLWVVSSVDSVQGGYIDRVEVKEPALSYRLPWRFGLGLEYRPTPKLMLAVDLRFTTGQGAYDLFAGPNGEPSLAPTFPGGQVDDPDRAIEVRRAVRHRAMLNGNLGLQYQLTDVFQLQTGAFTDFSTTPTDDVRANGNDQLNRVGLTLGLGRVTPENATYGTLMYAYGFGNVLGLGAGGERLASLRSHAVTIMIGTKADL